MSETQSKKVLTEKSIETLHEFMAASGSVSSELLQTDFEIYLSYEDQKIQDVEDIFVGNPFDAIYLYEDPKASDLAGLQRAIPNRKKKKRKDMMADRDKIAILPKHIPYVFKQNSVGTEEASDQKKQITTGIRFGFIQTSVKLNGSHKISQELFSDDMPQDATRAHYSPTVKSHNTIAHKQRYHLENLLSNWQIIGGLRADEKGRFRHHALKKSLPNYNS